MLTHNAEVVNRLLLLSARFFCTDHSECFIVHVSIYTHTHVHTQMVKASIQNVNLLIRKTYTHTLMKEKLGAIWCQYLAQGHADWKSWGLNQCPSNKWTGCSASLITAAQTLYLQYLQRRG